MLWTESVLIFLRQEKKVRVVVVVEAHAIYCKMLELEDIKMVTSKEKEDAFTFTFIWLKIEYRHTL